MRCSGAQQRNMKVNIGLRRGDESFRGVNEDPCLVVRSGENDVIVDSKIALSSG